MDSVPAMRNFVLDDSSSDEEGGVAETVSTLHLEECQDEAMEVCVEEIIEQLVTEVTSVVPDVNATSTAEAAAEMDEGGIPETASTVHLEEGQDYEALEDCVEEAVENCVEEIVEQLVMEISSIIPDITAAPTNEVDAAMDEVRFELNELGFVLFKVMRDDRSETSSICCLGEFPISEATLAAVARPAEGARRGVKTPKLWPAYCESVAALAEEVADLRRACNELQTVTAGDNEGSLDRRRLELELDSRLSRAEREYILLEYTRIKEFPDGVGGSR